MIEYLLGSFRTATVFVALILVLGGCSTLSNSARINPQTVAVYPGAKGEGDKSIEPCPLTKGLSDSNRGAVDLDCFQFPEHIEKRGDDHKATDLGKIFAYDLAAGIQEVAPQKGTIFKTVKEGDTTKIDTKYYRDRLAALLTKHADDVCVLEKGRLVATESTANFGLSFLTTALSTVSTIVGGEKAKSILSGLAAISSGTQDNVNATFYRNQLTQAINKSIDQERGRLMINIVAERSQGISDYTVDDMIRLINDYHHACSFERGLQLLLDAALDTSGANAVLEKRSREVAIANWERYIAKLQANINNATGDAKTLWESQLNEAIAKLHGLMIATTAEQARGNDAADTLPNETSVDNPK